MSKAKLKEVRQTFKQIRVKQIEEVRRKKLTKQLEDKVELKQQKKLFEKFKSSEFHYPLNSMGYESYKQWQKDLNKYFDDATKIKGPGFFGKRKESTNKDDNALNPEKLVDAYLTIRFWMRP